MKILKNESLIRIVNFAIGALFLSNLWIIIYVNLITFINFFNPPVNKEVFYIPRAFPEPFEIPFYVTLTSILVAVIWFFTKKITQKIRVGNIFRYLALLFLLFLFVIKLGTYPLAHEFYPYQPRSDNLIYSFVIIIYLTIISFLIVQGVLLDKLFEKSRLFSLFLAAVIVAVVSIFTFEPRFPISPFDYAHFFGPIWETITGKTLFLEAASDYGFLPILIFAGLFKLKLFAFYHLPVYVWLMFIGLYSISFYLIYRFSKSVVLSLIGLFSIITINYFSFFIVPSSIAQYSALRRLPAVLILLILYKTKKIDSKSFLFLTSLASFWVVDVGISNILALGFTFFYLLLLKNLSLKKLVSAGVFFLASLMTIFIVINLVLVILGYKFMPIQSVFTRLHLHAVTGLTMQPMPQQTFFWLSLLLYFSSILYVFSRSKIELVEKIMLLSANLMFFHSLYYVGRSDPANLLDISVLILLLFFLLIAAVWAKIQDNRIKLIVVVVLFILFVASPAYLRNHTLTELLIQRNQRLKLGNIFTPEVKNELANRFIAEKGLINKHFFEKEILILANDDTYFFITSGKKNLLGRNPQLAIDTVYEMYAAVDKTVSVCPKKIAVDCRIYKRCKTFDSYTGKNHSFAPFILERIEAKCGLKYKPIECTNKLCIAERRPL